MSLARNVVTTLLGRVILLGLSLISAVVLARALGPEGRGQFALVLLIPEFVRVFGMLGIDLANAVYAGLESGKVKTLSWHSVAIAIGIGGLLSAGGIGYLIIGTPGLKNIVQGSLWLYILPLALVPGRILIAFWLAILRGMNRILLLNIVEVGTKVISLALILGVVAGLHYGVAGAVCVDSAIVVGSVLFLAVLLASLGALGRPTFDRELITKSAKFAFPAYSAGVLSYLNYRVDQLIIAILLPIDQLAIYVIAVEIAERIWIVPGSISTALLPHLTSLPERDSTISARVTRHTILWTGSACLALFIIAPAAITLLFSSKFAGAATALRWLLPGIFILAVAKVVVAELLSREKIAFAVWASFIAGTANVCLNLFLIPRMGISGAALASSVSYFLVAAIVIYYYLKETRVSWATLVPRKSDLQVYVAIFRTARNRASNLKSGRNTDLN